MQHETLITALESALPATVTINADDPVCIPSSLAIDLIDTLRGVK